MDFEDSRNAIFCDPHAYIQGCEKKQIKKVVFAEPYDCLPNFYVDNDFKKHNCNCVPKPPKPCPPPPKPCFPGLPFNLDFKALMPILAGMLGKNGSGEFVKLLNSMPANGGAVSGFDLKNIIGVVAQNPKILQSIMTMFKGGGLNGLFKKNKSATELSQKQTDHIINNYTRVDQW